MFLVIGNSSFLYSNEDHTLVEIEGSWITGLTIGNSHRGKTHYLSCGTFTWSSLACFCAQSESFAGDFRVAKHMIGCFVVLSKNAR